MMATLKTSSLDELRKMTEEAQESAAKTVKLPLGLTLQTLVALHLRSAIVKFLRTLQCFRGAIASLASNLKRAELL